MVALITLFPYIIYYILYTPVHNLQWNQEHMTEYAQNKLKLMHIERKNWKPQSEHCSIFST